MSSTFTVTRDQVIQIALLKLGVIEVGDTPDPATISNASLNLNLIIKQMNTEGLKMWKNSELIIPLVANQTSYILGGSGTTLMYDSQNPGVAVTDKPLKAIMGFYRNTQTTPYIDTPLLLVSKQEYNQLGSKFSTGVTNTIFYDVKSLNGILYIYLTPDAYTSTNLALHLVAQMPLNDINASTDVPDFPNEWMNCLIWNLADQMLLSMQLLRMLAKK